MYAIHLYGNQDYQFPDYPVNTYITENQDILLETLKYLFENRDSGITRVVIENDEFPLIKTASQVQKIKNQSYMNLDKCE